ncbi:MAG: carbon-nitrogen hydrolase family protein [Thermotogaceae bacterium]|nr:carbon-nitrogen hydrolase family protein [Thermotogaceae bacterium]
MESFIAACAQFEILPMRVEDNLQIAWQTIKACKDATKADLIVLPETFTTGFTPIGGLSALWEAAEPIPGRWSDIGEKWAKELDTTLCFPVYERGEQKGIVYNSALLIGPSGILGSYRKTHPFPTERLAANGWTTRGEIPFCVKTPFANVGIVICYDGDFPELARVTAMKGAEVICRPSAFLRTFDQWELTNRARAYDNHVYWIATNTVGKDASGSHFFGSSMIIHPSGQKLAQARNGNEYIWATLTPDPIKTIYPGSSIPQWFDHIEDRNIRSYEGILEDGRSAFDPAKRIPNE